MPDRRREDDTHPRRAARGFTLVELLVAFAVGALLIAGLANVVRQGLDTWFLTQISTERTLQARFAMDRVVSSVRATRRLLIPLPNQPIRDVLAVTLDPTLDRDGDGFADGDNDKDGQIDEDLGYDNTNDGAAGIVGIDDDNDGFVDESSKEDDDEDEDQTGNKNEETLDGLDDDGDGAIDEDLPADMNGDGAPGLAGVDDDGDTFVDEGDVDNDDEEGLKDEDWFDPVVYFLNGTTLVERVPNLNPSSGTDFTEAPLAENVVTFRVERLPPAADARGVLLDITLELSGPDGRTLSLASRVVVGGAP